MGKARSRSRGRARSSSKGRGRGQSCDQGPASQAGPSQANNDQGPATMVLRDENGDPNESLPMETMEPLPPLSESIRNKALRQTPLTSYFKPMLSHITVLPNTDEVPIPTTEPQQSEPQQSVPKKSVP